MRICVFEKNISQSGFAFVLCDCRINTVMNNSVCEKLPLFWELFWWHRNRWAPLLLNSQFLAGEFIRTPCVVTSDLSVGLAFFMGYHVNFNYVRSRYLRCAERPAITSEGLCGLVICHFRPSPPLNPSKTPSIGGSRLKKLQAQTKVPFPVRRPI